MPHPFKTTGGALIGWVNYTWPLARLSAAPDTLKVTAGPSTYSFTPDEVSRIELFIGIPVWCWGIRIRHGRIDYPQSVIFWCFGNPARLLRRIRDAGFVPTASSSAVPQRRGMAFRWPTVLAAVIIWNVLFIIDLTRSTSSSRPLGPFALVALLFTFAMSVGTLLSPGFQRWVLKPDRNIGEVRPFLTLLAFISGIMLIVLSINLAIGGFP